MTNRFTSRRLSVAMALVVTATLFAGMAVSANAAPMRQATARIVVVGYPDLVGTGPQAGCVGCDLAFSNGDSLASAADPLPLLEFILRDGAGAEIERRTTSALADGRRRRLPPNRPCLVSRRIRRASSRRPHCVPVRPRGRRPPRRPATARTKMRPRPLRLRRCRQVPASSAGWFTST